MNPLTNWEFFKQDQEKILLVHIFCTEDFAGMAISLNNWWERRYPVYKMRVVSKNEFKKNKQNNRNN